MYKNVEPLVQRLNFNPASPFCRRPRVRQLRRDIDAFVAERRQRPLPLQRLRSLLQDERPKPSADQTETETGKRRQQNSLIGLVICLNSRIFHFLFSFFPFSSHPLGARGLYVPTARRQRRRFGDGTRTASRCATLADSTTNSTT